MIVLSWLKSEPTRWKTFIANRTSEIQELTENCSWKHVQSGSNPADSLSRGQTVHEFLENDMWLHGPSWLKADEVEWPQENRARIEENELPEIKICEKCKNQKSKTNDRTIGPLSTEELNTALNFIIRQAQNEEFEREISLLTAKLPITKSKLIPLNPFLDDKGILRVGGRLSNSNLSFSQKFPIILPANHKFTKLLIEYEHQRILHAGTQATLASLRQKYWPLNGRNLTRKIIYKCNNCFRFQATNLQQIMGDLPSYRTQSIRPFVHTGVDYAGPIAIKQGTNRKSATTKAYIALFVCLNTRSIHIELVSNLTKEAFLSALKRFIARRGKCISIHSDNATNFRGANNELKELNKLFNDTTKTEIMEFATNQGIQWHFIPPHAPNFGGIWEAGVKSVKGHLKRTIGNTILTFEEMQTLLNQIEACLNSRPLIPMSDDPSDTSFLTPAHFLIDNSLTAIPEPDLTAIKLSHLSRWQLIQQQVQSFWNQWTKSYLQQRTKWQTGNLELHVGALVLIREDHQPPLNWARGRVIEVYKGNDQCVRVVSVKTDSGVLKRPVNKLSLLPLELN